MIKVPKTTTAFLVLMLAYCGISRSQECNYITDYYQLVYQAQVDYLEHNYELAFRKLKKAESNCKLLNQQCIDEMVLLAVLYEKFGKKDTAFEYLHRLLKKGFPFERLINHKEVSDLKSYPEWQVLKDKSTTYASNFEKKIDKDLKEEVEQLIEEFKLLTSGRYTFKSTHVIDSITENQISRILRRKGYPIPANIGFERKIHGSFELLFTRVKDTGYFKQILLGYIKRGKGNPWSIGIMFDAHMGIREKNYKETKFLYGMADNLDSSYIKDFRNVDKRRVAIGLSPWSLRRKLLKLKGQGEFLENLE